MAKKTIRDERIRGKRALVRVDFNVPLEPQTGAILEDLRIRACLPTIKYLTQRDCKVILCSHLGRPGGKVVESLRLAPIADRLKDLLGHPVVYVKETVGPEVERNLEHLGAGGVMLLENLRFHAEEEKNDSTFAFQLARLCDVFVNDAFATAHRAHASTAGVAAYRPALAGLLMDKELTALGALLGNPTRPFGLLLGGIKVSDKIALLENLLPKIDILLIGGGMAATFLKAKNLGVGYTPVESDRLDFARQLLSRAAQGGVHIEMSRDVLVAYGPPPGADHQKVSVLRIPPGSQIMDIGPRTITTFQQQLHKCSTVLWNGPVGAFEYPAFSVGTRAMAECIANLTSLTGATTVVGGGETTAAVERMGLASKMTHISTGGGATLEFLEGKTLPGVAALQDKRP
ncbi:MAG: phosphoglycerate kinase [Chloroflexi bacterium]|nr:phosphoglycerate kinase [Chloroflexota bacterium]